MTFYIPPSPTKRGGPSIDDIRADYDRFEQRWSKDTGDYYWMNPFTGEILPEPEDGVINRSQSIWGPADPPMRKGTKNRDEAVISNMTSFVPQNYASRMWGRRPFNGFQSERHAGIHITSVCRGHLARKKLRNMFKTRFVRVLDKASGFYYFHDTKTDESLWHKPYLAFPDDVPLEDPFKYYLPSTMNAGIYKKTTGKLQFNSDLHAPNDVYDGDEADGLLPSPSKNWAGKGLDQTKPSCMSECNIGAWPFMVIRSWFDRYADGVISVAPFLRARERKDWLRLVALFRMTLGDVTKDDGSERKEEAEAKSGGDLSSRRGNTRPSSSATDAKGERGPSRGGMMDSEAVAARWDSPPPTATRPESHLASRGGISSRIGSSSPHRGRRAKPEPDPEPDVAALRAHAKAHQMFALYCMSSLPVVEPGTEGKKLFRGVDDAIFLTLECVRTSVDRKGPFDLSGDEVYKTFFFYLLSSLLETKGGRVGFFATPVIDDKYGAFGPTWEREREDEITSRVNVLASMLRFIPTDVVSFRPSKKGGKITKLHVATRGGSEMAESLLISLGMLAREQSYTDIISLACADEVVAVMPKVIDEVGPCIAALRCLYNCCFMNEQGQFAVLSARAEDMIKQYRESGVGRNEEVARECRRLELALEPDGWRGRVEKVMTQEFYDARAESRALKDRMKAGKAPAYEFKGKITLAEDEKGGDAVDAFLAGWS